MKKFLFFLFFIPVVASTQQLRIDTSTSFITYEASHPVHDWSGTSTDVQGVVVLKNDAPSRMAFAAAVSSFNSKNSNRDAHALEVLEALLFPKVSFYSDTITLDKDSIEISGNITFHGTSMPLSTSAQWLQIEDKWVLKGEFDIQPSSFGIKLPSFMLVKMRDNIHISFHLELRTFVP